MAGASLLPRQPRQLPWLIFETITNYKKWPKQLSRFEVKFIFIFLPSKKIASIYCVFFAELKQWILFYWVLLCSIEEFKYFYHYTKHKRLLQENSFIILRSRKKPSLNILGLLCRIEKNVLNITWRNLLKYPWSFWAESTPRMLKNRSQGWF